MPRDQNKVGRSKEVWFTAMCPWVVLFIVRFGIDYCPGFPWHRKLAELGLIWLAECAPTLRSFPSEVETRSCLP